MSDSVTEPASRPPRVGTPVRRDSLLMATSALVNGAMNAVILALSARQGQLDEIAAYTVMTAALTFVAVVTGGGAALMYISGDDAQRHAIRSQWVFVILPSLVLGTILIGTFYARSGYHAPALLGAGLVVVGNSMSQLQQADMARMLMFPALALILASSKVPAIVLVTAGAPLTAALTVATVVQFALIETRLGKATWLRRSALIELSPRQGLAAIRLNRQLFAYTLAELYTARGPAIVLSMFATPRVMGCYGAVVSVYQAVSGMLYASLRVPMANKVRDRLGIGERLTLSRDSELMAICGATLVAVFIGAVAPWIVESALALPLPEAADWLRILGVALPFAIFARAVAVNLIGDGDYATATRLTLLVAAIMTPVAATTVPLFGAAGTAGATLVAEAVAVAVIGVAMLRRARG